MQFQGFVDLHSHLVPGIDDGCQTIAESLHSIQLLKKKGFTASFCTPHIWPKLYPDNTHQAIRGWVAQLRETLARQDVAYQLWPGGEVRIAPDMHRWLARHGVPTLGESRCVLIDYWGGDWPSFADEFIGWLREGDYQPILAHPERMGLDDQELDAVADSLLDRGVWLQGNLRSLAGGEGPAAKAQLESLLTRDRIRLMATDAHRPGDLESRLAGIDALEEICGPQHAQQLLGGRQQEIINSD